MLPSSPTEASYRPENIFLYLRFHIIDDIALQNCLLWQFRSINSRLSLLPLKVESPYTIADTTKERI